MPPTVNRVTGSDFASRISQNHRRDLGERIRSLIHDNWFAKKKYISLLVCRGGCPLSHHERLVYSFVVWLSRFDDSQPKPFCEMASRLSIGERSVSSAAKSLRDQGLITLENGRANRAVIQLTGDVPDWLVIGSQGCPASNRYYLKSSTQSDPNQLTSLDLSLLASLQGLAIQRGTLLIENTNSGLATMVAATARTVRASLVRLQTIGLIHCLANQIALNQPSPEALDLLTDTGVNELAKPSRGAAFQLNLESDLGYQLNYLLAQAQEEQFASGWRDDQPFQFWNSVLMEMLDEIRLNDRLSLFEEFLIERYPLLWLSAEEQHLETGTAGNCRHLLKTMAQDSISRLRSERGYA